MNEFEIIPNITANKSTFCRIYQYNYINGELDFNSKEKLREIKYDSLGKETEELIYLHDIAFMRHLSVYGENGKLKEYIIQDIKNSSITTIFTNYDESGNETNSYALNSKGKIESKELYKYDDKGRISEHFFGISDMWENHSIYEYEDDGKLVIIKTYENDIINYDDNGNKIAETNEFQSGCRSYQHKKYNEDGKLIEFFNYEYENNPNDIGYYTNYTYDDNGRMIEEKCEKSIDPPAETFVYKLTFKYNENNKQIERLSLDKNNIPIKKWEMEWE